MTITFINPSQQTIQITTDDNTITLLPQQQTTVYSDSNTIECTLTPLMASRYDHKTGFDFITEAHYRITAAGEKATITLQVIKLSGWEYYTYVNAVSQDAAVSLLDASVADESALRQQLAQHPDFQQPNRRPKSGKTFDLVLSLLEGTPLAVILFFVGKANFGIVAGIIAALFGFFIALAIGKIIDTPFRRAGVKEANEPNLEEQMQQWLATDYVVSVITDQARYKNYL